MLDIKYNTTGSVVLLFCLITFTQVFQNVQKTLSFLIVNTFQSTWISVYP